MDLTFLDPVGRAVIASIESVIRLSTVTSAFSLAAAVVSVWTMQVTTGTAGLSTVQDRVALIQRGSIALLSLFLVLNAVTPFITPDPPWLANLPLVIAIGLFMLALGLSHVRAQDHANGKGKTNGKRKKRRAPRIRGGVSKHGGKAKHSRGRGSR